MITMTEKELIDYFVCNYTSSVDSTGTINIYVPEINDEEVRDFVFSSIRVMLKLQKLLELKYPDKDRRSFDGENIFRCNFFVRIRDVEESTIQVGTIYGSFLFYLKDIIHPQKYLDREIKILRKKLAADVDERLQNLGKAAAIQEETERKIKEWGLEND